MDKLISLQKHLTKLESEFSKIEIVSQESLNNNANVVMNVIILVNRLFSIWTILTQSLQNY